MYKKKIYSSTKDRKQSLNMNVELIIFFFCNAGLRMSQGPLGLGPADPYDNQALLSAYNNPKDL